MKTKKRVKKLKALVRALKQALADSEKELEETAEAREAVCQQLIAGRAARIDMLATRCIKEDGNADIVRTLVDIAKAEGLHGAVITEVQKRVTLRDIQKKADAA